MFGPLKNEAFFRNTGYQGYKQGYQRDIRDRQRYSEVGKVRLRESRGMLLHCSIFAIIRTRQFQGSASLQCYREPPPASGDRRLGQRRSMSARAASRKPASETARCASTAGTASRV